MNENRLRRYTVAIIEFMAFAILLLLHYSGVFHIGDMRANPIALIPLLVTFSFYNEEWASAFTGMAVGIFMDAVSSTFSLFHTVVFFFIGLLSCLIIHHLFNNNVFSAIALSVMATLVYFLLRWIFFHAVDGGIEDSVFYLMYYALPSVIYTNIFTVPFYYIQRKLYSASK